MKGLRKSFVMSILLVCAQLGPAEAASKLVASLLGPMEAPLGRAYVRLDRCLQDKTKGDLSLQIYPNAQLGTQADMLEQVRQGVVDMTVVTPNTVASLVPEVQVFALPFVFRDVPHWKDVVTGPIGKKLSDLTLQKTGARVLGYFGGSARQLVTTKPVKSVSDVRGVAMRLWPSVMQPAWSSIGVVPSNVAYAELYNALRSGSVGGFDSEPEWIMRMKFYEQAPNIALTSHEIVTRLILFSNQRFTKMSQPNRDALVACVNEAADFERNLEIKLDQDTLNTLIQKHNVKTTSVNKDEFQKIAGIATVPLVQKYGLSTFVKEIEAVRK